MLVLFIALAGSIFLRYQSPNFHSDESNLFRMPISSFFSSLTKFSSSKLILILTRVFLLVICSVARLFLFFLKCFAHEDFPNRLKFAIVIQSSHKLVNSELLPPNSRCNLHGKEVSNFLKRPLFHKKPLFHHFQSNLLQYQSILLLLSLKPREKRQKRYLYAFF